jgi:hypothetical protein
MRSAAHRSVLLDWMLQVADAERVPPEVFFLAAAYLDACLGREVKIPLEELQLLGATCLWVADKFMRERPLRGAPAWAARPARLSLAALVSACAKAYSAKEFTAMERLVLDLLGFRLYLPTTYTRCCERKGGELSPGELLSLEVAVILRSPGGEATAAAEARQSLRSRGAAYVLAKIDESGEAR